MPNWKQTGCNNLLVPEITTNCPSGSHQPFCFSELMEQTPQGIEGVMCYLDLLIIGKTPDDHWNKYRANWFRLKCSKCAFLQPAIGYLGYCIHYMQPPKIDAILKALRPCDLQLQCLL